MNNYTIDDLYQQLSYGVDIEFFFAGEYYHINSGYECREGKKIHALYMAKYDQPYWEGKKFVYGRKSMIVLR